MDINQFHFTHPLWLCGFLIIPLFWLMNNSHKASLKQLERMIDKHLIPFLLLKKNTARWNWKPWVYSMIWGLLILALAGPRWQFRDIEVMTKNQNLVLLLDLSKSMDVTDIKPSRLIRARQKIEDFLNNSPGIKIGLIAFAADPHMITPLTDDKETIRHLLHSLDTDLAYVQGSNLSPALQMAYSMLKVESHPNQAIVILSDGGMEIESISEVADLAKNGITVHTIGIGTIEGALLHDKDGNILKKDGKAVLSKLERERLQEISQAGQGLYLDLNQSEMRIIEPLTRTDALSTGQKRRIWEEGYAFFLFPAIPLLLYCFRKGVLTALAICLIPCLCNANYFKNNEEQAAELFENGNYQEAAQLFSDPYRKGVSLYKAGDYSAAENMFRASTREEIGCAASYNLGNALAQQHKFKEAIAAYENVLNKYPDHQAAKENLELVRKILKNSSEQENSKDSQQKQNGPQPHDNEPSEDNSDNLLQERNEPEKQEATPKSQASSDNDSNDNSDNSQQKSNEPQNQETSLKSQNSFDNPPSDDNHVDLQQKNNQSQKQETPAKSNANSDSKPSEHNSDDLQQNSNEPQNRETQAKSLSSFDSKPSENHSADLRQNKEKSSQDEVETDFLLNRLSNDPKNLLKNKFYIETKNRGTREGLDPW